MSFGHPRLDPVQIKNPCRPKRCAGRRRAPSRQLCPGCSHRREPRPNAIPVPPIGTGCCELRGSCRSAYTDLRPPVPPEPLLFSTAPVSGPGPPVGRDSTLPALCYWRRPGMPDPAATAVSHHHAPTPWAPGTLMVHPESPSGSEGALCNGTVRIRGRALGSRHQHRAALPQATDAFGAWIHPSVKSAHLKRITSLNPSAPSVCGGLSFINTRVPAALILNGQIHAQPGHRHVYATHRPLRPHSLIETE